MMRRLLTYPGVSSLALDDPRLTVLRRGIIRKKVFLRKIYEEWYSLLSLSVPAGDGALLELGSGAGFLQEYLPGLITSELLMIPDIRLVCDGQMLPFAAGSLKGILMTDVFHHFPDAPAFLAEAGRCVRPGGMIAMIEPWNTPWSRFIYKNLHHEPFEPQAIDWQFPSSGPISSANGALPWIVFARDRAKLAKEFPGWDLEVVRPMMPFRYLLSGGVSLRAFMPGWSYDFWKGIEQALSGWMEKMGMFAYIVLRRNQL